MASRKNVVCKINLIGIGKSGKYAALENINHSETVALLVYKVQREIEREREEDRGRVKYFSPAVRQRSSESVSL